MVNIFCIRPKGFNIGNDVIYQGTLAFLQAGFGSQVNVISLPATSRYETHGKAGLTPRTIHEINQYGHGVIVGGGNLYENGELQVSPAALEALEVPLFLFSLSSGRIYNRRGELVTRTDAMDRGLIQLLNEKASYSLARDDATAKQLQELGCTKVRVGGCPTLFLDQMLPRIPLFTSTPAVLFSIRTPELMNIPLRDQARVRSDILGIIDLLHRSGHHDIKLLCHDHRDIPFAASFDALEYLHTDDAFTYLGWLRSCKLNIGYRLHAVLPCLSFGTPTVGISYDERATSLMHTIGMSGWDINMMVCRRMVAEVANRLNRLEELPKLREQTRPRWEMLRQTTMTAFKNFATDVLAQAQPV